MVVDVMKRTTSLIASLAIVAVTAACSEHALRPTSPDSGPTPGRPTTTPDFSGTWVGESRVISCEHAAGGCASYPAGYARYLDFRLTQNGDDVSGNLSPTQGGPTALPAVFWISGRLAAHTLPFQPMDVPGASGGLISYTGELTLDSSSPTTMLGRMTERTARPDGPLTIVWEVRTSRLVQP